MLPSWNPVKLIVLLLSSFAPFANANEFVVAHYEVESSSKVQLQVTRVIRLKEASFLMCQSMSLAVRAGKYHVALKAKLTDLSCVEKLPAELGPIATESSLAKNTYMIMHFPPGTMTDEVRAIYEVYVLDDVEKARKLCELIVKNPDMRKDGHSVTCIAPP